jgi:hypothetical protein
MKVLNALTSHLAQSAVSQVTFNLGEVCPRNMFLPLHTPEAYHSQQFPYPHSQLSVSSQRRMLIGTFLSC